MRQRPRITLDPGHGGRDTGVVEYGIVESRYVMAFAHDLSLAIRHLYPYASIAWTRTTDKQVSWEQRREEAEGSDLVLSLHVNGYRAPVFGGALALFWPGNELGEAVSGAIARALPVPLYRSYSPLGWPVTRDDWPRAYEVVRQYNETTVLVELGYATNPHDAVALEDPDVKQGLIVACLAGVTEWMRRRQWGQLASVRKEHDGSVPSGMCFES